MAKMTVAQWRDIRNAYEVSVKSTVALAKEYGIADTTIQRRLKKEGWSREKTQDAIHKKVSSIKAMAIATQENAGITQALHSEVERRLRLEGMFMDALEENQLIADSALRAKDVKMLNIANVHSQVTTRNKDSVMGKMPQTQVNIQNNTGIDANAIMDRLRKKHGY